jgi:hypothetical protein
MMTYQTYQAGELDDRRKGLSMGAALDVERRPVDEAKPAAPIAPQNARALFDLIGGSALVSQGQALLVSLVPVKAALGQKWDTRREQIYESVERHIRKHLSPTDICERASETHFLVATPDRPGVVGQALCYRALKDVLTYFLGRVDSANLQVSLVTSLSADGVEVQDLSTAELEKADAEITHVASAHSPATLAGGSGASWPLRTGDGQDLRVSFGVDPVMDLKAWAMAGHRIESRIVNQRTEVALTGAQRRGLLPRDFEAIDLAALERGMSRLTGADIPDRPKLIIQMSFASLSNSRARSTLLAHARQVQGVMRHAAICELVDVEAGIPASRLMEVGAMMRGFFRRVWVQVQPIRILIEAAEGARSSGLTVRAADLGETPEEIAKGMRHFVSMVKRPGTLLIVTSLPSTKLMIDAMSAGFSHATLHVVE